MEEEVIIKHKRKKTNSGNGKKSANQNPKSRKKKNRPFDFQYKIIAVLLMVLSVLIFLSLVSYHPLDESIAQFTLADIFGYISGDEIISGQVAQVNNWLGLSGAIISYALFHDTIGGAIFLLPLFVFLWAKHLYKPQPYGKALTRYTIVFLVVGICFAAFMGSLQLMPWGEVIPQEWSGIIGIFLATITSALISSVGSIVLFLLLMLITVVLGFDIPKDKLKAKSKEVINKLTDSGQTNDEEDDEEENEKVTEIEKDDNDIELNIPSEIPEEEKEPEQEEEDDEEEFEIDIANIPDDDVISSYEHRAGLPETKEEKKLKEGEIDLSQANDIKPLEDNWDFEKAEKNTHIEENIAPTLEMQASNISKVDSTPGTPLTVEVELRDEEEEAPEFEPLGTAIHDEEINYEYPNFDFLNTQRDNTRINEEELKRNSQIIRETFETFKILIEKLSVTPGPVVTQYEFVPARGIKVSKISSYADDIAMALKAKGIRIIAPIPGKGTVGIEIPNSKRTMIRFHDVVNTLAFAETKATLPMALGKTISGETYITDLAKMPHLLIAGTTGAGKSVGINTIILSLLYKLHPSELKFVIIDPKRVEMNQYADLGHLFMAQSPDVNSKSLIINDPDDAILVLNSTVKEMENRYKILERVRLKNIADYNKKVAQGVFKNDTSMTHRKMPYIVVIVDELADLMMSGSKKEIEFSVTRLAQMARAVGIHLILATQRPSTDVITGLIKANFPARMAYRVNSGIDSRTILDQSGAEKLIGYGDMLCMPPGVEAPVRVQNAFVDTDEIENICAFMQKQEGYSQPYMLPTANENEEGDDYRDEADLQDRDSMFEDAARLVVENQIASVSMLQRRMKIGYARAGRIIDQLEYAGIVGKFKGSKSREVLLSSTADLESIL